MVPKDLTGLLEEPLQADARFLYAHHKKYPYKNNLDNSSLLYQSGPGPKNHIRLRTKNIDGGFRLSVIYYL